MRTNTVLISNNVHLNNLIVYFIKKYFDNVKGLKIIYLFDYHVNRKNITVGKRRFT
jgi:hypothetical protein